MHIYIYHFFSVFLSGASERILEEILDITVDIGHYFRPILDTSGFILFPILLSSYFWYIHVLLIRGLERNRSPDFLLYLVFISFIFEALSCNYFHILFPYICSFVEISFLFGIQFSFMQPMFFDKLLQFKIVKR